MSCCGNNTYKNKNPLDRGFDPYTDYPPSLQYPEVRTAYDIAMQKIWSGNCGPANAVALGTPVPLQENFSANAFSSAFEAPPCSGYTSTPIISKGLVDVPNIVFNRAPYAKPFSHYPNNGALALQDPYNLWSYTAYRL